MPDNHDDLTEKEAHHLIHRILSDPAAAPPVPADPSESLGDRLRAWRQQKRAGPKLALALGIPRETLQRWEADIDLPTAPQLLALCDPLGISSVKALRLVRESARRAFRHVLTSTQGLPRAMAARQRGTPLPETDAVLVERMPLPLRRALAERLGSADTALLAAALRALAQRPAAERDVVVAGLAAALELDG